jgi:hypothetical protein
MDNHYVYRHKRVDTNEVFYIGKGSTYSCHKNSESYKKKYRRAFNKKSRNKWWNSITSKTDYIVEIVAKGLLEEEAFELEKFLILLYGRKDLSTGTLINLTDGGEGTSGAIRSASFIKNIKIRNSGKNNKWYKCLPEEHPMFGRVGKLNPFYEKKHSEKSLLKMKGSRDSIKGENHPKTDIILNTDTGIFYFSIVEAANSCHITYSSLRRYLNDKNKNPSSFVKVF